MEPVKSINCDTYAFSNLAIHLVKCLHLSDNKSQAQGPITIVSTGSYELYVHMAAETKRRHGVIEN